MTAYQLQVNQASVPAAVTIMGSIISIPFDPSNTDYQKFKTDVLDGDTLENVDGVAMTQEEADAFIATLP